MYSKDLCIVLYNSDSQPPYRRLVSCPTCSWGLPTASASLSAPHIGSTAGQTRSCEIYPLLLVVSFSWSSDALRNAYVVGDAPPRSLWMCNVSHSRNAIHGLNRNQPLFSLIIGSSISHSYKLFSYHSIRFNMYSYYVSIRFNMLVCSCFGAHLMSGPWRIV